MLKRARQEQVYNKEHFLAVQAARDRAEFERVLRLVVYLLAFIILLNIYHETVIFYNYRLLLLKMKF